MSVHSQFIVTLLNNNSNICKFKKSKLTAQCNQEQKNTPNLDKLNSEPTETQVQQYKSVLRSR